MNHLLGTLGFYEQKKDEGEDKKERLAKSKKGHTSSKRKEIQRTAAVRRLIESLSISAPAWGQEITESNWQDLIIPPQLWTVVCEP